MFPVPSNHAQTFTTAISIQPPTLLLSDGYVGTHALLDGCTMQGSSGYSSFRASHSIAHGCWYVEVSWLPLDNATPPDPTTTNSDKQHSSDYAPAVRIGWCTAEAPIDGPVGFDACSFGYASRTGHAFHQAQGKPYGRAFGQPFTSFSLLVCQPARPTIDHTSPASCDTVSLTSRDLLPYYMCATLVLCICAVSGDVVGMLLCVNERDHTQNTIHFSLNGCWQGAAFTAIPPTHYYPAVSAYQHAQVHCRFQPPYVFTPPWAQQVGGGGRVQWRAGKEAAIGEMSYRYWRRDKKEREGKLLRRGERARRKPSLCKPE